LNLYSFFFTRAIEFLIAEPIFRLHALIRPARHRGHYCQAADSTVHSRPAMLAMRMPSVLGQAADRPQAQAGTALATAGQQMILFYRDANIATAFHSWHTDTFLSFFFSKIRFTALYLYCFCK